MYRHGDLLLVYVDEIPASAERVDDLVLARGEATGHKHQLVGNALVYRNKGQQYVEIVDPTRLTHEEHHDILLPPGCYVVIHQREYDPYEQAVRDIVD